MADENAPDTLTPEAVAAIADAQLEQLSDPEGFARRQAEAQINADYEALAGVADDDTKAKLAAIRDARLAQLDPPAPEPVASPTFGDLSLTEKTTGSVVASWTQAVEPTRDGQPWCSWEDAEAMLVEAAKTAMRGRGGLRVNGYKVTRDESAMTLTLELV